MVTWMRIVVAMVTATILAGGAYGATDAERRQATRAAAARDARANLQDKIDLLAITETLSVGRFVARTRGAANALAKMPVQYGKAIWRADGTCEVAASIKVTAVYRAIAPRMKTRTPADKATAAAIRAKAVDAGDKALQATGVSRSRQQPTKRNRGRSRGRVGRSTRLPAIWDRRCTADGRIAAQKAARADGGRKLSRRIKALRLGANTTVADLAAADRTIRKQIDLFCVSAAKIGTLLYHTDELIVDVKIQIRTQDLAAKLKSLHAKHYRGDKIAAADFNRLTAAGSPKIIEAIGSGTPPERYLRGAPTARGATALKRPAWPKTITAQGAAAVHPTGENKAQATLRAKRAAEAEARKNLAAKVNALPVAKGMTVKQFVASSERIASDMNTYLNDARVVSSKVNDTARAEAVVNISTAKLWTIVTFWQKELGIVR